MSAFPFVSTMALSALVLLSFSPDALAAPDLASVRELYAAASYEEALAALKDVESTDNIEVVEQYRALCLLGLGRSADAEQALERIVMRRPLYVVSATDVSPRLVTLFHEVRRRSLPTATREVYTRAKTSYDRNDHKAAARQFKDVLTLVSDPDLAGQNQTLAELKQLAEGFMALSEAALAAAVAPVAPPPPAPVTAPVPEVAKAPSVARVYTTADSDVVAPQAIKRAMPGWRPPNPLVAQQSFHGVLEVVINEQGLVERAGMSRASFPSYDADLLTATKEWRFRPATRNGEPVKFHLAFEVALLASREE